MSYVESFETEMSRARILMADCDIPLLDRLQTAHDAEMKQLSKEEFHRGYESGVAARDAEQWQLDRKRHKVVCELQKLRDRGSVWGRELVVALGLSVEATNDDFCDRLIYLIGDESIDSGTESDAKVIQNGEKYQFNGYDVLGNERHKAVCELRNARDGMSGSTADNVSRIMYAIDARPKVGERACKAIADRLIHLLGGDDGTASNDDRTCPIPVQSPSITDELREYAMTRISPNQGMLESIADRIDEQFNRICSQQESVLQQTISDTVNEHEREMAELRQKLSARDAIIDNYHERMKGLDEAERRMAFAESKCKELQSKYDNLLVTCKDLTSLANKYFNEVNELLSDETN